MKAFDQIREKLFGGASKEVNDVEDQSQEEKDLVSFVRRKLDESRSNANRIAHEGIWMTNIAYLMGFDSVYYDTQSRQYLPLGRATQFLARNRVHSNKLLPLAQNRLARLCKTPPRFETVPNSQSDDDKEAALLGLDILVDHWHRQQINRKRIAMMMWMQQCGHAYLKVSFDPMLGEKLRDPITGESQGHEGEVRVDVVSGFEVFPDPLAKDLDERECAYVIQAKIRPIEYFRTHYDRGRLVKPEKPWLLSLQYEARVNSVNVFGPGTSGDLGLAGENTAVEISYYERPTQNHEKGRHIVVANGALLKDDSLPHEDMYPLAKFDDIVVGGKYYSECCVTHARPLQDQYNAVLTRRAEWSRKMLAGKYVAAKGHGLHKEALNDRNGEVVEYNPVPGASEPHALQIPTIPEYAYRETEELEKEMSQIFGLSEISRGIVQPSMPAIGMQLIIEQDETRIGIEIEQHEHAYARVGTLILKTVEKYYKTERTLQKKDDLGNYLSRSYRGDSLKGNTKCMVIRGSTVPTSRSLRRQDIVNSYNLGLLGNPADPAVRMKVMQLMEFGDNTGMWRKYTATMQQIKRALKDIEQGVVTIENAKASVSQYDNHLLFIEEFDNYRISEKYDALPEEQKQAFLMVMDAHLEWQARLSNPQVAVPPKAPMNLEGALDEVEGESGEMAPPEGETAPPVEGEPQAPANPALEDGFEISDNGRVIER